MLGIKLLDVVRDDALGQPKSTHDSFPLKFCHALGSHRHHHLSFYPLGNVIDIDNDEHGPPFAWGHMADQVYPSLSECPMGGY